MGLVSGKAFEAQFDSREELSRGIYAQSEPVIDNYCSQSTEQHVDSGKFSPDGWQRDTGGSGDTHHK